ncbi:unnamed protein product [Calypogeia fissa]
MGKGEVFARRRKEGAGDEPPPSTSTERDSFADRKRLGDLIETATTSPLLHLEDRALTSIKSVVRASDDNVRAAFDFLLDRLKKNHSQVRYLAVLLIDELFTRSKLFRSLLVPQFETFILLSVGFRADYPLPPPDDRAKLLRKKSIELVEKWKDMFGQHYKPIRLGHEYLKNTLRLEFPNAREVATLATQQRREREERTQELLKRKFQSLREDFPNLRADIQSTLDEINQCLEILVPPAPPSEDAAAEGNQTGAESLDEEDEFETYGVESLRHLREVVEEEDTLPQESTDNSAVFDTLRDLYKLLTTRQLVNSQEWLTTLMRVDPGQDRQSRDTLLREIIDLRNHLLQIRTKCEGSGIQRIEGNGTADAGEEFNDEIWEQGDVLTNPLVVPQSPLVPSSRSVDTPSSSNITTVESDKNKSESEKMEVVGIKQDLLKQAPVLPWGTFLDTWGSQSAVPANPRGMEYENHWGKVDYDVMIPAEKIAEISVRASYYKAPKVEIPPCRAPLRSGGLCQRRDHRRCPLHGPIRPRDEKGNIIPEEVEHAESSTGLRAENVKSEELTGTSGDEADGKSGIVTDSQSLDPAQLAEQAIGNVRKMDEQARAQARRQRAKRTREHNEACLREAATAQIRLGEFAEVPSDAFGDGDSRAKKPRGGLTALLRKKPTVKDRISRRLLNGRVTDATVSQLARDQDAAYRESFPNQWTMK